MIHIHKGQVRTKYEFCESVKMRGYAEIDTELKLSDPMDIRLYHMRSIFTPVCHRCKVGVCRRYALEAIINAITYLHVQNYVYVPCYNCYASRVCNNMRLGGRLICTCGIINGKKYS